MLSKVASALIKRLSDMDDMKQVEFYEGQFEKLDEYAINPPTAFIEFMSGKTSEADGDPFGEILISIHLITSRLNRSPQSMLGILTNLILELNKQPLLDEQQEDQDNYIGRMFVINSRKNLTFPGLVVFEMSISVKR